MKCKKLYMAFTDACRQRVLCEDDLELEIGDTVGARIIDGDVIRVGNIDYTIDQARELGRWLIEMTDPTETREDCLAADAARFEKDL